MPANLTSPINVIGPPSSTSEISILEIVIRPEENVSVAIAQGSGASAHRVPGMFTIEDCEAHTQSHGGRDFVVTAGNHFTDMVAAAPIGASNGEVVKSGVYSALMNMFPDLQGAVV